MIFLMLRFVIAIFGQAKGLVSLKGVGGIRCHVKHF